MVLDSEPVYCNIVVGLHESPREEHLEWLGQIVPANDIPCQVLAVGVGIAEANVGDDVVRMAADALVREDGKADKTQTYQAQSNADDVRSIPTRTDVIRTNVFVRRIAVYSFDLVDTRIFGLARAIVFLCLMRHKFLKGARHIVKSEKCRRHGGLI